MRCVGAPPARVLPRPHAARAAPRASTSAQRQDPLRPSAESSNARASPVGLQVYRRKRKFDVTSEPRGRTARKKGDSFVIQKHAARRLHYDLRLELDGVMKSWAVTRGPSLNPAEK